MDNPVAKRPAIVTDSLLQTERQQQMPDKAAPSHPIVIAQTLPVCSRRFRETERGKVGTAKLDYA